MNEMLAGKSALVTGAGSGIGRATCLAMAAEGAKIMAADLNGDAAEETAAMVREAGGQAVSCVVDVTQGDQVLSMIDKTVDAFGKLDCAFNNAGITASQIGVGGWRTGDISEADWSRIISVNLTGVWLCLKHEMLCMEKSGGGAIVNMSSVGGLVGLPGSHAYVASKHGVVGLTKAASIDHARVGIRVNAVCPGYIETPARAVSWAGPDRPILTRPAMRRFGQSEEVANLVAWLLSDRASFVTGSAYPVDGGYTT